MPNRKTVLLIAGALLAAGAAAAISAPGERGHRMGGPMFGWGEGHKGKGGWSRGPLTQEAMDANTRARFARMDANSDGALDAAEIEAKLAQRAGKRGNRAERMGERRLRRFDADRDGKVTRDEFSKHVRDRFARLDLNNDARITDADLPPVMRGRGVLSGDGDAPRRGFGRRLANLSKADADKDGAITLDEMLAGNDRRFILRDRNGDGVIDKADADVLRKDTLDYRVKRFAHGYGAGADGTVTKDQFFAKARERFARMDRDNDGSVSRRERSGRDGRGWHRRWSRDRDGSAEQRRGDEPSGRDRDERDDRDKQ